MQCKPQIIRTPLVQFMYMSIIKFLYFISNGWPIVRDRSRSNSFGYFAEELLNRCVHTFVDLLAKAVVELNMLNSLPCAPVCKGFMRKQPSIISKQCVRLTVNRNHFLIMSNQTKYVASGSIVSISVFFVLVFILSGPPQKIRIPTTTWVAASIVSTYQVSIPI